MKFTIVGDPHIVPRSLDKAEKLFSIVEELGNPGVWLGDLQDTKEVIHGKCLNSFYDYFTASKFNHICLVGNHDWFSLQGTDHSLRTLKSIPNVTIVDSVTRIPNLPFVFFPYEHDLQKLRSQVLLHADLRLCAVGHFDLLRFDFGNGHLSDSGLCIEDFRGYKRVVSGHYHKYQQCDNFTFLGTPFSHSFGESDQEKFIGIYDTETDQLELVPTPFPRHVTLKLDMSQEGYENQLRSFIDLNASNYKRVQLFGTSDQITKLNKSDYEQYDIRFDDKSECLDVLQSLDESLDNNTQFVQWAKDIRGLDQATINLGLSIMERLSVR